MTDMFICRLDESHTKDFGEVICNSIPFTTRRMLFASSFMCLFSRPSRYFSGSHCSVPNSHCISFVIKRKTLCKTIIYFYLMCILVSINYVEW
uniref:Uncharacterized protein n=1 Tax=Nelumbo nucifera TaxID=4432 RepID=A0A822YFD4_NELNU|nr:TPA_asm: hypothetical protein HUJ06_010091 [Nelumbo nucifera]